MNANEGSFAANVRWVPASVFRQNLNLSAMLGQELSEIQPLKINNPPVVNVPPEPILWIEVSLANGETKLIAVEALSRSKVVMKVCNSTDTTGLTRTR